MKKRLINWLATTAAVSVLSWGAAASASVTTIATSPAQQAPKPSAASFLFVIQSAHSRLTKVNEKNYTLVLPLKDIKSVLAFSNRPERIVRQLTPAAYSKIIHSGSQSFDKIPPNVALTSDAYPPTAFEVSAVSKDNKNITYHLLLLDGQNSLKNQSGAVRLFFDDQGLDLESKTRNIVF